MVQNNSATFSTCITSAATLSIDLGVLICVIGFLDPYVEDPNSCTNLFPNPNSNVCPFVDPNILTSIYNSSDLNITKGGCVSILSVCNPLASKPFCVCCCCYCYCKFCGFSWLSI
jgi:hypothetical protein